MTRRRQDLTVVSFCQLALEPLCPCRHIKNPAKVLNLSRKEDNTPISVYREMPIQSCGQSVSAPRGKAGARLNAHTELRAKRQRSAREVIYPNRPVVTPWLEVGEREPGSAEPGSSSAAGSASAASVHQQRQPAGEPPWEPVNRRRVRGKGWHIDIGPGRAWRILLATSPNALCTLVS